MAYVKQTWTDRVTEFPIRRKLTQVSGDVYDISREQGIVQQEGTPITAERLNHMEDGILGAAVPDGNYPDMSVGSADQIGASHRAEISDPFVFRPTAGTIDVSVDRDNVDENAEITAIYGKTVVWNQISNDNTPIVFSTPGATKKVMFPIGVKLVSGHKYYMSADREASGFDSTGFNQTIYLFTKVVIDDALSDEIVVRFHFSEKSKVFECGYDSVSDGTSSTLGSFWLYTDALNLPEGGSLTISNFMLIDLTRMFGSGSEPTAEEFRSMFPLSYYSYDAGSLLSFSATGLKTVGFNLLSGDGTAKLVGGKEYRIEGAYTALSFNGAAVSPEDGVFTVSGDGVLTVTGADSTTCVHFRHSGYRDGEYEAYRSETLTLPISTYFPTGMKSVGTVKDELRKDMAIQRIAKLTLAIDDMDNREEYPGWKNCGLKSILGVSTQGSMNAIFIYGSQISYNLEGTSDVLFLSRNSYGLTQTEWKELHQGEVLEFYIPLLSQNNTPINPPLDFSYRAEDFGTEEVLLPSGTAPTSVPMYADISYEQNLRDKLDHLPFSPSVPGDYLVHYDGIKQTYVPASEISILAQIADRTYEGVDLTVKFAREIEASPYNGNPWAWIKARIQNGNFSGIHVCDWIPFIADSHTYKAQVAGINTYKGYGGTAVGNHIDFISKELWHVSHTMNPVDFNNGTKFGDAPATECPWIASDLYLYLNSLSGTVASEAVAGGGSGTEVDYSTTGVYDKLPDSLKAVIIGKVALLETRYYAASMASQPSSWGWKDCGKLWLPTEVEVVGCGVWAAHARSIGGTAVQYPIFCGTMNRVKYQNNLRRTWWTLTPGIGGYSTWCDIFDNGAANADSASRSGYSIPICFRIG